MLAEAEKTEQSDSLKENKRQKKEKKLYGTPWQLNVSNIPRSVSVRGVSEKQTAVYPKLRKPAPMEPPSHPSPPSNSVSVIRNLPQNERPREKLQKYGGELLSTSELIAIIIGSGTKKKGVLEVSQEIVTRFGSLNQIAEATIRELQQIDGMGLAKAIQLKAACALGVKLSRQVIKPKCRIEHPDLAYQLIRDELEKETRELFAVILQDARKYVICHQLISMGTLTHTLVHPREVFYPAIRHKAASLILVHNHPSGDPTPSPDDIQLTLQLITVGTLIDIPINDHLIIGNGNYVSMRQRGLVFFS